MPSSMIFAGLVVIWLLILVPAVARHRQEVARPSVAALSGRVLERPRRRQNLEVDLMDDVQQSRPVATRTDHDDEPLRVPAARAESDGPGGARPDSDRGAPADHDADRAEEYGPDTAWAEDPERPGDWADVDEPGATWADGGTEERGPVQDGAEEDGPDEWVDEPGDGGWERPPPRFRPGRGGFDPEAAALTARARYAIRQRVVLTMLIVALATGVLAAVALPVLWWPHAAVDLALVGYLVYLRRQVRMEESIRERRAARMAGTRRPAAAEDPELDEWARRGRNEGRGYELDNGLDDERSDRSGDGPAHTDDDPDGPDRHDLAGNQLDRSDPDGPDRDDLDADDLDRETPERVTGVGEPLRQAGTADLRSALPRLQPAPPPPLPPGTALVEADDQEPELHELDAVARPGYRRAAGE